MGHSLNKNKNKNKDKENKDIDKDKDEDKKKTSINDEIIKIYYLYGNNYKKVFGGKNKKKIKNRLNDNYVNGPNKKYKFQYTSKIDLTNLMEKLFMKINTVYDDSPKFIQFVGFFDKKILICDSYGIKIYSYPSFSLLMKISSKNELFSATLLKTNNDLACCECNGYISFVNIGKDPIELRQRIQVLEGKPVYRIKELLNTNILVSCQDEHLISFYEYDQKENLYNMTEKIEIGNFVENLFYTKNNDILLLKNVLINDKHYEIDLFDFHEMKIKKNVLKCQGNGVIYEPFKFVNKNIVAIIIASLIFLIDINQDYTIINKIQTKNIWINCICEINNYLITGSNDGLIELWKFEKDQNQLCKKCEYFYEKKEKQVNRNIKDILYLGNNLLIIGGSDEIIRNFYDIKQVGNITDIFEIIEYNE